MKFLFHKIAQIANLFTVSNHDERQELHVAEVDHDQRSPVGEEVEGLRLVGAPRRDLLQHHRERGPN